MEPTDDQLPLDADGQVTLPTVDVLTGRGFITGKSGSGKSNSASVIIEELLDRGFPVAIVDTDGEYWGLKEQYEVLHVGADEECDLQVGAEHAEKLASLALEDNVPIILDVSGFLDEGDANDLVREFARHLFAKAKKLKNPFLLLVEEVHEYIPEGGGMDDTGEMLVKIGKRGRKHGLGLAGISQRPADVKKDFITQCDWLLWHRLTWENDTTVVRRVVGSEQADAISELDDGEAFLQADFLAADVTRVQARRKRTFDAGATPGLDDFERPDLQSVSGDLVDELEEISEREERRQDRIAQLEARIEDLREDKAELEDELEAAEQNNETVNQLAEQLATISAGEGGGEALENIREEKNARIRELETDLQETRAERDDLADEVESLRAELQQRPEISERAGEAVAVLAEEFGVGGEDAEHLRQKLKNARKRIDELESEQPTVTAPDEYDEFVEDEFVREAIEAAKTDDNATPRYVKGVVAGILQRGGAASREDIAADLGIESTGHIGKAMRALEERDVIETEGSGATEAADFAFGNIEAVHERRARQRRTEEVMDGL